MFTNQKIAVVLATCGLLAVSVSCSSSGPQPPQPGTPAYNWSAAKEAYRAGDYLKTSENLQRLLAGENEFTARARALDAVISAGMAHAYIELADSWETGARANRLDPTPFRKQVITLRNLAGAAAMQFTEDVHKLVDAEKGPVILLACAYPTGPATEPVALKRVSGGILVQESERDLLQTAMVQRGVLRSVNAAVGSPADAAAAQEKLKTGEFQVPRATFIMALAKSLSEQSELFTGTKLDQPNKLKLMSQEALEALKSLPESKDGKTVTDKIQARLKKARITL